MRQELLQPWWKHEILYCSRSRTLFVTGLVDVLSRTPPPTTRGKPTVYTDESMNPATPTNGVHRAKGYKAVPPDRRAKLFNKKRTPPPEASSIDAKPTTVWRVCGC